MNNRSLEGGTEEDIQFDLREWLRRLTQYWWVFILGLMICVPTGYLYLRYATFEYATSAKLLIKDVGTSGNLSESGILVEDLGIGSGRKDMDNEIEILKSRPLLTAAVEKIGANIIYYRQGRIKDSELYKDSPIVIDTFALAGDRVKLSFFIKMDYTQSFSFSQAADEEGKQYRFGEPFVNEYGYFKISQSKTATLNPGIYMVSVWPAEDIAAYYKSKLLIEIVGAQNSSSILELKLTDQTPEKAEDLINTLIDVYNTADVNDDTKVLRNTIEFIDQRVARLTEELNAVEGDIERFKSENQIITESASASLGFALNEMRSDLAALSSYELENELLLTLEESLTEDNFPDKLIPVNLASSNQSLSSLIDQYNSLFLEKQRLSKTVTENNPILADISIKMEEFRNLILSTIRNIRNDLQIPIARSKEKIEELKSSIRSVPTVEKSLLEKIRTQSIKESLFLFLLQRREETALSEAITTPNTRIIESARSSKGPVYPQKRLIYLASILLGIFLPFVGLAVKFFFETTVDSEDLVKKLTSIPIIGRISHFKGSEKIFVSQGKRTVISEMFRLIRTNLNYAMTKDEQQVMLVTSSVSAEGKSVVAINLGLAFALTDKKVIVLDLDLRRPTIASYLKSQSAPGVTNYLVGENTLEDVIRFYSENENLAFITSGPIPPNPAELLLSTKMGSLIQELKKSFDHIIIDTPPIGIVADALLLREFLTKTLLVVRMDQTKKEMVRHLEEMYQKGELISPYLVINDIKSQRGYYGYGGYNYGYGSGYYLSET
ncbi:MAG: polysaccharide biosynthesis tyrosine autokinase [Saprospiraceae bacterium]|nr:polysaccharide biosynthesis tyrosine autokinase [Saprospiraceae bacterium]